MYDITYYHCVVEMASDKRGGEENVSPRTEILVIMSICPSVTLFGCLSICMFVCLFFCLFVICLCVRLYVCVCLSVCLSHQGYTSLRFSCLMEDEYVSITHIHYPSLSHCTDRTEPFFCSRNTLVIKV